MQDIASLNGLERDPFSDENVEGLFYPDGQQGKLLPEILHHCRYNDSILVIEGERGYGKTTLKSQLLANIEDDIEVANVSPALLSNKEQLLEDMLQNLSYSDKSASVHEAFDNFIAEAKQCDRIVLLLIDDAHLLAEGLLEYIDQLVKKYNGAFHCLLFANQTHQDWDSSALDESNGFHRIRLLPLTEKQCEEYVYYRLETAGWHGRVPFSVIQMLDIYEQSGGIPALVNQQANLMWQSSLPAPKKAKKRNLLVPILAASSGLCIIALAALYWPSGGGAAGEGAGNAVAQAKQGTVITGNQQSARGEASGQGASTAASNRVPAVKELPAEKKAVKVVAKVERRPPPASPAKAEPKPAKLEAKPAAKVAAKPKADTAAKDSAAKLKEVAKAVKPKVEQAKPKPAPAKQTVAKAAAPKPKPKPAKKPEPKSPLTASEQKLMSIAPQRYVLQLLGMRDPADLDAYFRTLPRDLNVKTYRRQLAGKPFYVAVYGDYKSSAQALAAVKRLPKKMQRQKPWAKSVASVQKEIRSSLASR